MPKSSETNILKKNLYDLDKVTETSSPLGTFSNRKKTLRLRSSKSNYAVPLKSIYKNKSVAKTVFKSNKNNPNRHHDFGPDLTKKQRDILTMLKMN